VKVISIAGHLKFVLFNSLIHWVPGALSLGLKWLCCEIDHSPPSNAKVRMHGAVPPLPQYAFIAWCSIKSREATLPYKD